MKKLVCLCLLVSGSLLAQFTRPVTAGNVLSAQQWFEIYLGGQNVEDFSTVKFEAYAPTAGFSTSAFPAPVLGSLDSQYSAVYPVIAPLYSYYSGGTAATAPPDPQMIFLDGQGDGLVALDMETLKTVSQTDVPSMTGPFGLRPNANGPPTEVWVLNGNQSGLAAVTVVNLTTQTVAAGIFTPSIPAASFALPMGIVFTNDGATAIELLKYDFPDSSGNNGAYVVFNAAAQTVTSTTPVKFTPAALLMAPDGLTAYILSSAGTITYYDVLSGTADLTAASVQPGSGFGYPGIGAAVGIHPDGTRIFWNVGIYLVVFDLTSRQITNTFSSGLPTTITRTFSLSPDGEMAYFSDTQGDVVVLDTYSGATLKAFNANGVATSIYGGPPVAP